MNARRLGACLLAVAAVAACQSSYVDANTTSPGGHTTDANPGGGLHAAYPSGVPATYDEDMEQLANGMRLADPPAVQPIRAVGFTELPQVMATCLTEAGFPTSVSESGEEWEGEGTKSQAGARLAAEYVCLGLYPLAEIYSRPWTPDQVAQYRDWMVQETLPCIRDLGYEAPQDPTLEDIAAQEALGRLWDPMLLLPGNNRQAIDDVLDRCELEPPPDEFYGSWPPD